MQLGVVVIPKSVHVERMKQNFDVFDFKLTDKIATLVTKNPLIVAHREPEVCE